MINVTCSTNPLYKCSRFFTPAYFDCVDSMNKFSLSIDKSYRFQLNIDYIIVCS